jgi:WD40 repeat protein
VEEVATSRDGKRVASVGSDRSLRIWSASGEKELKNLSGAAEWLYAVDFDESGRRVAAGAWDGTLRLWDVESGRVLAVLIQPPASSDSDLEWALVSPRGWFRASERLLEVSRLGSQDRKGPELPLSSLPRGLSAPDRLAGALRDAGALPPLLGPERQF